MVTGTQCIEETAFTGLGECIQVTGAGNPAINQKFQRVVDASNPRYFVYVGMTDANYNIGYLTPGTESFSNRWYVMNGVTSAYRAVSAGYYQLQGAMETAGTDGVLPLPHIATTFCSTPAAATRAVSLGLDTQWSSDRGITVRSCVFTMMARESPADAQTISWPVMTTAMAVAPIMP